MIPTPAPTAMPSSFSTSSLSTPSLTDSSQFHPSHHPKTLLHHHQQQGQQPQEHHQRNDTWITALFESSADPIVVCDLNGLVCAWSHGAQTTFNIHPKHSLGLSLRHIFSSGSSSPPTHPHSPSYSHQHSSFSTSSSHPLIPSNNNNSNSDNSQRTGSDDGLEIELYPSTPEQVQALQGLPLKRVVSRVVGDQSRHLFLESISPVFQQPSAAPPLAPALVSYSSSPHHYYNSSPPLPPSKPLPPLPPRPHGNPQQHHHNAAAGTGAGRKSIINGHSSGSHSHTADKDDPTSSATMTLSPLPPPSSSSAREQQEESTPILSTAILSTAPAPLIVGYSVILTDLSTLSTGPGTTHYPFFASYPQSSMASSALTSPSPSSFTTTSSTQTTKTTSTSAAPSLSIAEDTEVAATEATSATALTTTATTTALSAVSYQQTQQTHLLPHQMLAKIASDDAIRNTTTTSTTASWSAALPMPAAEAASSATATVDCNNTDTDKDDLDSTAPIIAFRPSTSREHSTDSGFDERSPLVKPKSSPSYASSSSAMVSGCTSSTAVDRLLVPNGTAVIHEEIQSEPDAISPHGKISSTPSPSIAQPQPLPLPLPLTMPTSRSNSISLPIHSQEPSVRPSARSTSLGHLLSLPPLSPLPPALANRPRALSIAATAISSTSTGAQLSVSLSASADKSRLDIHHNSLAISAEPHHSTSLLPGETRLDREWDDPSFSSSRGRIVSQPWGQVCLYLATRQPGGAQGTGPHGIHELDRAVWRAGPSIRRSDA
ncbi:hypothetical protein K457DRAFT_393040 [Linnemannia elongata AG-77]|uniref:PAS domain-containing protein n=1 Tax=Linnemannia elongata AG-77 TaxID=1314771 RepID=A0A197K134_9FUNG|nr:hypothetical protein K457DRAFT_393040 [Linnemannia elongata AG-77]